MPAAGQSATSLVVVAYVEMLRSLHTHIFLCIDFPLPFAGLCFLFMTIQYQ